MNLRSTITTSTLAIAGLGMAWYSGGELSGKGHFDFQPNPLGLKGSPYGQVIAMAVQAPIDADWHGGIEIHDMPSEDHSHDHDDPTCSHDHEDDHEQPSSCDTGCGGCDHHAPAREPKNFLERLSFAVGQRTNPNPPTLGHRFYLRREIEKKMRFAYTLDPSHYGNYNTYNLFLTEPELGTSGEVVRMDRTHAISLAEHTIRYCLRENTDPRPALTAASAAYNILESQILEPEGHTTEEMRDQLSVLDFCLKRHFELLEEFMSSGYWDRLSPARQSEVMERSRFTLKLRESAEAIIVRLEKSEQSTASIEPS